MSALWEERLINPNKGKKGGWNKTVWPPEALEKLGKVPDEDIAKEYGIRFRTVAVKRQTMGIPHFKKPQVSRVDDPNEGNEKWQRLGRMK